MMNGFLQIISCLFIHLAVSQAQEDHAIFFVANEGVSINNLLDLKSYTRKTFQRLKRKIERTMPIIILNRLKKCLFLS